MAAYLNLYLKKINPSTYILSYMVYHFQKCVEKKFLSINYDHQIHFMLRSNR